MKKVAIVADEMTIGGCEKALISMLQALSDDKYRITLFLRTSEGEYYMDIPKWVDVKIIPHISSSTKELIINYLKKGQIINVFKSIIYLPFCMFTGYYKQLHYTTKILPRVDEKFDLAVSYHFPAQFPDWYTVNNIDADKRVVWIHSDISIHTGINCWVSKKMYSRYNKIFCVSKEAANKFIKQFPELADRVSVFYNIISKSDVINKGNLSEGFEDDFSGVRILTVGRLSKEKGQDLIPGALLRLINDGYDVRWYCIGDGELRKDLESTINQFNLSSRLILVGKKKNPYPFMKQCNIYVQPSRYEAYCTTVCEARCFNKPIVTTDVVGAREQIINGKTGFIVDANEEELYMKLKELLDDEALVGSLMNNSINLEINTLSEIEKFYELLY